MTACYALVTALLIGQGDKTAPALTDAQRAKLQSLINTTQKQSAGLKEKLDQKQRELAKLYAEYNLNEKAAKKLQNEIIDLQKQVLTSYHQMQVDLRREVGAERFNVLRQRIDRILNPMKD